MKLAAILVATAWLCYACPPLGASLAMLLAAAAHMNNWGGPRR